MKGGRRDAGYGLPVIHEDEATIIRNLVAKLPFAGSTRALFEETYPTYWPDGSKVTLTHLKKIFTAPIYRGTYVWGDVQKVDNHPAIIGPDAAAIIDRLNGLNKATKRKENPRAGGLLAGMLWCVPCGRRLESNTCNHSPCYRCQRVIPGTIRAYHFGISSFTVDDLVLVELWRRLDANLVESIIAALTKRKADIISVKDAGAGQLRTLQKRVDGLSKSLGDDELNDLARKVLIQQLNDATRALEEFHAQTPRVRHVDADLASFERLRQDPAFVAMLPLIWDDQPLEWRRKWVRIFIERVEFTTDDRHHEIVVRFVDGLTRTHALPKLAWGEEEHALLRSLLADQDRPKRGVIPWLEGQLKAKGYSRTRSALYKAVAQIS